MQHKTLWLCAAMLVSAVILPVTAQKADDDGWVSLLNGENLDGWHLRGGGANSWTVHDGMMSNAGHGTDLISDELLGDIELHVEFRVPAGSNSGVYLQGRYEVQVLDSAGATDLNKSMCGAIYDQIAPSENAAKPAGEWQTFDIKFRAPRCDEKGAVVEKAHITVVHNDVLIVDDQEIQRPTGGELDSKVGEPGPVFVQGDHGVVDYRNIRYRPLAE